MRIPNSRGSVEEDSSRAMTPMIDVVFLLLIFFVCAAVGQRVESTLATDLSSGTVGAAEVDPEENPLPPVWLYLSVDPDGVTSVEVNKGGVDYTDMSELRKTLFGLAEIGKEDIPIILDVAADVPAGDLILVYDTCKQAEFQKILFATDQVEK